MKSFLLTTVRLVQIFMIPVFLLGGSIRLITTDRFLEFEYARPGFPPDPYGFNVIERLNLADKNLEFVRDNLPITTLSQQEMDDLPVYNLRELGHMQDVQDVYQAVWRVWQISLILIFAIGIFYWFTKRSFTLASNLQTGGLFTAGLVVGIGLMATFGWQLWFDLFHRFFFQPGSWLFSYSDTLIRLFPIQFWFDITLTVSIMSLIGATLLILLGWRWKLKLAMQES